MNGARALSEATGLWRTFELAQQPKHCNKGAVGGPVIAPFQVAMPVRNDIEPIISALALLELHHYPLDLANSEKDLGLTCNPSLMESAEEEEGEVPVYRIMHLSSELLIVLLSLPAALILVYIFPQIPALRMDKAY